MKGSVNEFNFSNLPKLSRASLALTKMFPDTAIDIPSVNKILSSAIKGIEQLRSEKLELELISYGIASKNAALDFLPQNLICFGGEIFEKNIPFAILVEERAAIDLVYLLLGSDADLPANKTALTPVEEGIFSFVLSLVYNALQKHLDYVVGCSIRLGTLNRRPALNELFSAQSHLLNFSLKIGIENHFYGLKFLISAPSALPFLQNPAEQEEDLRKKGLGRASELKTVLRVNVGQLSLEHEQLKGLQVDDIVIIEEPTVRIAEKNSVSGKTTCLLGDPQFASAEGEISLSRLGNYRIQILNLGPASSDEFCTFTNNR